MRIRIVTLMLTLALGVVGACSSEDSKKTDRDEANPNGANTGPGTTQTPPSPSGTTGKGEPPPPPPTPPKVDVTNETITVNGVERTYVLVSPKTPDSVTRPLVLAFHGDGGDGPGMRAAYPIETVSSDAAIVAYPSGKKGFGWDLFSPNSYNPDIAFVTALINSLKSRFTIDASRIFAVGFSSGGFFINQIACRMPGLLRGIVVHGGGAPQEPADPSASTWPNGYTKCANQTLGAGVAAMFIHGQNDAVVAPESGEHAASYWAYVNNCTDTRVTGSPAPCENHASCPSTMPVTFCKIPGMGHEIWGPSLGYGWGFMTSL
jgi:polyhydroxybutyrate depolymerase